MKPILKTLSVSLMALSVYACSAQDNRDTQLEGHTESTKTNKVPCRLGAGPQLTSTSPRIEALIKEMSLEEKTGQLHQMPGGRSKNLNSKLTPEELDRVRAGRVGSYLHVAGAAPLKELQRVAIEEGPHGIPLLFAMDVVHGYKTIFPVPLAMASTWEPEALTLASRIAATEASSAGLHWTFAPMIDIARDPRWGRIVEGAGSDPYLGSRMAVAQVEGFQGDGLAKSDTLLATAKHFGVYGAAIGGRDYGSSDVSKRSVHEIYLPPFYAAAKAGSGSMMTAFNDVGGVPVTGNAALINGTLRSNWGFDGMIVSDWNAVAELINHGVADSRPNAGALSLSAGVDMDMASNVFADNLGSAVDGNCELSNALDNAVRRVLLTKERLGLFDDPYVYHDEARESASMLTDDNRAAARDIAAKSIVLLKNDNSLLPLSKTGGKIVIVGTLAADRFSQLGSWRAQGKEDTVISLVEGLTAASNTVSYADAGASIQQAVAAASSADTIILVTGENYDLSGEARSRASVNLPAEEKTLSDAILALDKPTVTVLTGGRPLAIPNIAQNSDALLQSWILGVEAGPALADIIFGETNPAGRLPISMPRATGQAPLTYSEYPSGRPANPDLSKDSNRYIDLPITPQFPFGHGLSYTKFDYGDITLNKTEVSAKGDVKISIPVTNSGELDGDEVVQLYLRDPLASVARPQKMLRGFKRVFIPAGQTKTVTFTLSASQTALFSEQDEWQIEAGDINVMIGASSADIRAQAQFEITSDAISKAPAAAINTPVEVK